MTIRVIVTGGRFYGEEFDRERQYRQLWLRERDHVNETLNELLRLYGEDLLIVQGGAKGADRAARDWALRLDGPRPITFAADWRGLGRAAGPIRNGEMVAAGADLVVAFPGNSGTADCVRQAREARLYVLDLRLEGPRAAA